MDSGRNPMGIEQPIKRRRGRPAGSRSTNAKMEEKVALLKWRTDLLDSGAGSSCGSDKDDDVIPMDDELAIVVAEEPEAFDDTDDDDDGEVIPIEIVRPRRVGRKKRKRPAVPQTHEYYANDHRISVSSSVDKNRVAARAKEIQSDLPAEHPSFIKHMLKSHVVRGFWLSFPVDFCRKHFPEEDIVIVLQDENGEDHDTTYLGNKVGLSAGWRGFAIDHDIKVGDVVVFELVKSTKFKVHIVRANEFTTADVDPSLQNLEARKKGQEQSCEDVITEEDTEVTTTNNREVPPSNGSSRNDIGISDAEIDFDDVTSVSDVNVILDCLGTDFEFHAHLRETYYELCCSQKSLLHKHLPKQLHPTFVAGVIIETVSIANGIRACNTVGASFREDFLVWKKTLESFELLGMNVAFLLNRVNGLIGVASLSRESHAEWEDKCEELKLERARAGDKMKALELRLLNAKGALQKVDSEMEELQSSLKKSDAALQELASAPW